MAAYYTLPTEAVSQHYIDLAFAQDHTRQDFLTDWHGAGTRPI